MTTMRLTMSQALVKFLDQQFFLCDGQEKKFVEGIFSIFGHGNVLGLGEALENEKHNLKFFRGSNEQGMAHAATAFAKQNNRQKICAVTTSIGPGATNLVTAAATATINRLPLLLLPGDIFSSRQPDPVLQQLECPYSQSISVNECLKPVSRYFDRIDRPEQLISSMIKAMKVLTDPSLCGTVTICLPQDVQCEAFDFPELFFKKRVHEFKRKIPDQNAIKNAAHLINSSERPLIIAGGGVKYSGAFDALKTFASVHKIFVSETQAGKSVLKSDHPQNLGGVGVLGTMPANELCQSSDCIIAIGTRLSDFTTCSKTGFDHSKVRFININVDPFDCEKMNPALSIEADAKLCIEALSAELSKINYATSSELQSEFVEKKFKWNNFLSTILNEEKTNDGMLDQTQALLCLNQNVNNNCIVVAAAGSLPGDLQRLWQCKKENSFHLEYGYSCMGYEVAGGLGAKMADDLAEVWVCLGDGSFLMMHSEIITAICEHKKINILLFDSGGFSCIKGLQCGNGSKGFGTDLVFRDQKSGELKGDQIPINFKLLGESLGLKSFRAHDLSELKDCIHHAQKEVGSTLIEIKVKQGSQSDGCKSFWRADPSALSKNSGVTQARKNFEDKITEPFYF